MEHPDDPAIQRRLDSFERLLTKLREDLKQIQEGRAGPALAKTAYQAAGEAMAATDACQRTTNAGGWFEARLSEYEDEFAELQTEFRAFM